MGYSIPVTKMDAKHKKSHYTPNLNKASGYGIIIVQKS